MNLRAELDSIRIAVKFNHPKADVLYELEKLLVLMTPPPESEPVVRAYKELKTIPSSASPIVKFLFAEMKRQRVGVFDLSERAGLAPATITGWRKHSPKFDNLEACLNVLGFTLKPVRQRDDHTLNPVE